MSIVTPSTIRRMAGAGLAAAAAGIPIQIAGGADYPTVPPGLLILTAAAALVLFVRTRWALVAAMAVTLFISVGAVATPNLREQLSDIGNTAAFAGSVVQVIGLLVALGCGSAAIREAFRASRISEEGAYR